MSRDSRTRQWRQGRFLGFAFLLLLCMGARMAQLQMPAWRQTAWLQMPAGLQMPGLKFQASNASAVVLYAWYDEPSQRDNLRFFLEHVVFDQRNSNIDFVFIDTTPGGSSIQIPDHMPNVQWMRRTNVGYDMCSWQMVLLQLSPQQYTYFVLMNGSVRGPFGNNFHYRANDNFLGPFERLLGGRVHMAGTTINCWGDKLHLQSMFLVTDSVGVEVVNATLQCIGNDTKSAAIDFGEIALSQNMLKRGFGLAALQPYWRGHNFLDANKTGIRCKAFENAAAYPEYGGDPFYSNADVDPVSLKPRTIDPEEVIMFKANRHLNDSRLLELTSQYDANARQYNPLKCNNMFRGHCRDEAGGAWSYRKADGSCTHTESDVPRDAEAVRALPKLFPDVKYGVLDFGGGVGAYLASFRNVSLQNLVVIEPYDLEGCLFQGLRQERMDLVNMPLSGLPHLQYDLVMTIEVCEYVPVEYHPHIIHALTQASRKYLLFSAAHPGQPGEGHIGPAMKTREQWINEIVDLKRGEWVLDQKRTDAFIRACSSGILRENAFVMRRSESNA